MKTLMMILAVVLTVQSANAQSLSAYDRAFPDNRPKDAGLYHFLIGFGELITAISLSETSQANEKELQNFWRKMLPNESGALSEARIRYDQASKEAKALRKNAPAEISVEQAKAINDAELRAAELEKEVLAAEKSFDIARVTLATGTSVEATLAKSTVKRLRLYSVIQQGVAYYLLVDLGTRWCVAAFTTRSPGILPGLQLIPVTAEQLKRAFGL